MVVTASIDSSSGICGKARIKIFELYLALKYKRHNLYYKHFTEKCFVIHVKRTDAFEQLSDLWDLRYINTDYHENDAQMTSKRPFISLIFVLKL